VPVKVFDVIVGCPSNSVATSGPLYETVQAAEVMPSIWHMLTMVLGGFVSTGDRKREGRGSAAYMSPMLVV
jgi:hypothetical protein